MGRVLLGRVNSGQIDGGFIENTYRAGRPVNTLDCLGGFYTIFYVDPHNIARH